VPEPLAAQPPRSIPTGVARASAPRDPWSTTDDRGTTGGRPVSGDDLSGQPAGMVPRTAATVIDAVIVGVAWFVGIWLFLELLTITGAFDPTTFQSSTLGDMTLTSQQYGLAIFAGGILVALRGAYLVYGWTALGRTPGQELAGLAVTDAATGGRLSLRRSAVRWFVSELPGVGLLLSIGILVWYGAIALTTARSPSRRGLHDVAAGSMIVRRPREAAGSRRSARMTGSIDPAGQAPGPQQDQTPPPPGAWQAPPAPPAGWQAPPIAPASWAPPPTQPGPAAGIVYAGFVVRLVAYILDGILLAIVESILGAIVVGASLTSGTLGYGSLVGLAVINLVLSGAYFIYTWTRMRASPGDRLLGLMVLNSADGSALTVNQAALRWVLLAGPGALATLGSYGFGVGALISLLVLAWYIYLAWSTATDPKRQGFHDKYVNSVVVKATLQ
jgi:uncharacterized RDD family membrane protein YckC